jgi:hypothetical protein
MNHHSLLRIGIIAGALASLSPAAQARNDWRCDAPIDSFAPPGCVYIPDPDDGVCSTFAATGAWTCLSGWLPGPGAGERLPPTELQSVDPATAWSGASQLALATDRFTQRIARIEADFTDAPTPAAVTPLLSFRQPGEQPVQVDVLLVRDGETIEVFVIGGDSGSSATLATLPLNGLQTVIYARWSAGRKGPRLVLDAGTTRVETVLPVLDRDTRLIIGGDDRTGIELDYGMPWNPSVPADR